MFDRQWQQSPACTQRVHDALAVLHTRFVEGGARCVKRGKGRRGLGEEIKGGRSARSTLVLGCMAVHACCYMYLDLVDLQSRISRCRHVTDRRCMNESR